MSIAEAAEQLEIHPRTLRRYIKDGRLTVMRLSQQVVRIRPEDLFRFRDQNIKVNTGTGICYVPRDEEPVAVTAAPGARTGARPAPPAEFRPG